jgi:hypothetical protein
MRKIITCFRVLAVLLGTSRVASATQYPNAVCPDSVTVTQLQDVTVPCHPASGDTVRGVGGIIIGFDPIASGFYTYFQTSGGGPFTGIEFYNHAVSLKNAPYNFVIGDSIVVEFAATLEFQSSTEIQAPNNSFGTPNFIVRRVGSSNPLPPFFVGTTTQLKESSTNTLFEQYEGCLVKINGPLKVVRTSVTGGLGQNNGFLVIRTDVPGDSVFVDGNRLTTYAPPPVGTFLVSVQGIGGQNLRGYRIMLRDANDIVLDNPPNVTDAFPLTDATIKVTFDRSVTTASATNTSNYSLASFGSVTAAGMIDSKTVQLTINNGLSHGQLETVTVVGVTGLDAGLTMTTPESRTFVNGLLTAEEVQRADPGYLSATPCVDRSRFAGPGSAAGTRASMSATAGARYGSLYYMMDAGNPSRGGVGTFAPPTTLTIGDSYRLTGQVEEFNGETEFINIVEATDLGPSSVPSPKTIRVIQAALDSCDFSNGADDGEDYEGRLVTLPYVKVVGTETNGFDVADQTAPDTILVENFNGVLSPLVPPPIGDLVTVTGVVHYSSAAFHVIPRSQADIVDHGTTGVVGGDREMAFRVYPNPARVARIAFSLAQDEDVEIGIFDVAGRCVANLVRGRLPAGRYTRDWSGRAFDGRSVGAGVFFARMKAGGQTRTIRAVYLGP